MHFDLAIVGGGIAGASLGRRMAAAGAKVLIAERETKFRDRIRGEALQPWGVAEAQKLGVADILRGISSQMHSFDQWLNGIHVFRRDLVATTLSAQPMLGFYHPQAQELLLGAAETAGACVRRGATATHIQPGQKPVLRVDVNGSQEDVTARLIAICAGRNPALRAQLGFQVRRGEIPLLLSGVWLTNLSKEIDHKIAYVCNDLIRGAVVGLFPQPDDHARAYFGFHPTTCQRLQGDNDFARFLDECKISTDGTLAFGDAKAAGPLASFECVDVWVEHPYGNGVALVGDAASSNDPSWGQGLSLALRDARVLSDQLLANDDWNAAGRQYAEQHDHHYGVVRTVSGWFYDLFQRLGPEAEARRARALPLLAEDQTRAPDVLFSGPDIPLDKKARARFFGEDVQASAAAGA